MNIFDLDQWKRQNITGVYHRWQKLLLELVELKLREVISREATLLFLVVGVPNVGKSTLINSINQIASSRFPVQEKMKWATVVPLPGVTQDIAGHKIAHQPSIYVLNTPGVLLPSIPDIETGLKLALVDKNKCHLSPTTIRRSHIPTQPELIWLQQTNWISLSNVGWGLKVLCLKLCWFNPLVDLQPTQAAQTVACKIFNLCVLKHLNNRRLEGIQYDSKDKHEYNLKDLQPKRRKPPNDSNMLYVEDLVTVQCALYLTLLEFTGNVEDESDLESLMEQ